MSRRRRPNLPPPPVSAPEPGAATLDQLFSLVPNPECKGLCQDSCGPVPMGPAEAARVAAARPGLPPLHVVGEDLTCPALGGLGTCTIYADRPMMCRLYGAVEGLPCAHGCVPAGGRVLSDLDAGVLISAALRAPE